MLFYTNGSNPWFRIDIVFRSFEPWYPDSPAFAASARVLGASLTAGGTNHPISPLVLRAVEGIIGQINQAFAKLDGIAYVIA